MIFILLYMINKSSVQDGCTHREKTRKNRRFIRLIISSCQKTVNNSCEHITRCCHNFNLFDFKVSANTASFFLNFEIMSFEFFNKAEYASLVIPSLHVKNYINPLMQTTSVSTYLYDKQKRTANAVPVLQYGGESGI